MWQKFGSRLTKNQPKMRSFVLVASVASATTNQTTRQLRGSCIPSYHVNCMQNPNLFLRQVLRIFCGACPACFFAHFSRPGSSLICIQDVCLGKWVLGLEELMMMSTKRQTDWWFGNVWNMFIFPYIGIIIPTDYCNIFQRSRYTTNQQTH